MGGVGPCIRGRDAVLPKALEVKRDRLAHPLPGLLAGPPGRHAARKIRGIRGVVPFGLLDGEVVVQMARYRDPARSLAVLVLPVASPRRCDREKED